FLDERTRAYVLKTDCIQHTAVSFNYSRRRVPGQGSRGEPFCREASQSVQIYELRELKPISEGTGCADPRVVKRNAAYLDCESRIGSRFFSHAFFDQDRQLDSGS